MYVRTPRKYRGRQRRSVISCKSLFMTLVITPLLLLAIAGGVLIYQNADDIRPVVMEQIDSVVGSVENSMATVNAPTPTATVNPVNILVNADNFWDAGSVNEALSLYIDILPSVPNDAQIYTRVVTGLISTGEVNRALMYAEDAVTADPYSSDAWAARAWTLDWSFDAGGAIVSALHAEALDPQNVRAVAWLAEAYASAGQPQRALDTANRAIEMNPDSAEAYRARGIIYSAAFFDNVTAVNDLETAFEIAAVNNPAMLGLIAVDIAQLSITNQDIDDAIAVLERVLELNPENTGALYWMGTIYFANLGDPAQASTYVTRCVEANPESVNCHYMLGRTQMKDQPDAAAQSFVQAVNLGSQSARQWWWAANGQVAVGRCDRARDYIMTGYNMAQDEGNDVLVGNYEYLMTQCQITPSFSVQPTPTAIPPNTDPGEDA